MITEEKYYNDLIIDGENITVTSEFDEYFHNLQQENKQLKEKIQNVINYIEPFIELDCTINGKIIKNIKNSLQENEQLKKDVENLPKIMK